MVIKKQGGEQKLKMICIHHAGGSIYSYANLKKNLSGIVEVIAIELPGHGKRINEAMTTNCYESIISLCHKLKESVEPYEQYILFGHSMGAWLAYGVIQELENEKCYYPCKLILSGNTPPFSELRVFDPDKYSDEEFINRVSEFGGIPEEILKSKSYMEYYIEVLRSDYKLVYELPRYLQKKNINCKFDVICGNNDLIVNDSVIEWGQIACQEYNLFRYKRDHFSILDKVMNRELKEYFKSIF